MQVDAFTRPKNIAPAVSFSHQKNMRGKCARRDGVCVAFPPLRRSGKSLQSEPLLVNLSADELIYLTTLLRIGKGGGGSMCQEKPKVCQTVMKQNITPTERTSQKKSPCNKVKTNLVFRSEKIQRRGTNGNPGLSDRYKTKRVGSVVLYFCMLEACVSHERNRKGRNTLSRRLLLSSLRSRGITLLPRKKMNSQIHF